MKSYAALKFRKFHDLMPHRVREILLVSSLYDAFILQEDGHLTEQIFLEYKELSLSSSPRFTYVSTGEAALREMASLRFDLVLVATRLPDMDVLAFARKVKEKLPNMPVVVLSFDSPKPNQLETFMNDLAVNGVFSWSGDAKILLAMTKYIEDWANLDNDIAVADVRVILVVEDSVWYYSAFLSALYPELMKQSQSLFSEGLNRLQKLMRMRSRPKVILATTYETAQQLYKRYQANILAVISDVGFCREGEYDPEAGVQFISQVRANQADLPVLLQSAEEKYAEVAKRSNVLFVNKNSAGLLSEIRQFLKDYLGFGPFIFRLADGTEVDRANDTNELEACVRRVPGESLEYHAKHDHFSNWLMARSEFDLAQKIKAQRMSDYSSMEEVRQAILKDLDTHGRDLRAGVISDFAPGVFESESVFQRIGSGSVGGKARGLAFLDLLLSSEPKKGAFSQMPVRIPQTFAITTDAFDEFLSKNDLYDVAYGTLDDREIALRFQQASLPSWVENDLRTILANVHYPLAVRSSSLLEDSMLHPFAGIYGTVMLANSALRLHERLLDLLQAIKHVYASTFFRNAKAYVSNTARSFKEEKMGVVIQRLVGQRFHDRFYPHFAGVAQSYNYYPVGPQRPEEGVVQMVLGFGHLVVEGGTAVRFSPAHPGAMPQYISPRQMVQLSQRHFYALDLARPSVIEGTLCSHNLALYNLNKALDDGPLKLAGSVYNWQDDVITENFDVQGPYVVTFNNILKHKVCPLPEVLAELLHLTAKGVGAAVEMEFACDMGDYGHPVPRGQMRASPTLYALQVRPIVTHKALNGIQKEVFPHDRIICRSDKALGHGYLPDLFDLVYVKPDAFTPARSPAIAEEVGGLNQSLQRQERSYVLIGPGRWGSSDPWLGIPVEWGQIAGARIIIEASPEDYQVDPSQGTHFFHNMVALGVGYFTIPPGARKEGNPKGSFVDWAWLDSQPAVQETRYLRHVRVEAPLVALIDGRESLGIIARRPEEECDEALEPAFPT